MTTNRRTPGDPTREDQTRDEIIAAAKTLAQRHGLRKVTMDDIARAVGKKKSFLYYYYPGKREVIEAVVEREFAEIRELVHQAVSAKSGALEQLRTFFVVRMETFVRRASEYGAAAITSVQQGVEPGAVGWSLLKVRQAFDRQEEQFVARLIRQGIDEGTFAALPAKVIEDTAYFLLSASRGVELELAFSDKPMVGLGPRFTKVFEVLFRGLAK